MARSNRPTITVNVREIIGATSYLDTADREVFARLSYRLEAEARRVLYATFSSAVSKADSQDGFPPPFQKHVLESLGNIEISSVIGGSELRVTIDFDSLGDWEDLKRAFHQGARLADGSILWGPYEGQALARKDSSGKKAHDVWLSIRAGASTYTHGSKSKEYSTPDGSWAETMNQYISIWGNKAPEWMYVQFGQQKWNPKIPVGFVIEDVEISFKAAGEKIFAEELEKMMYVANYYAERGIHVTPVTKRAGNVRLPEGTFATANVDDKYRKLKKR